MKKLLARLPFQSAPPAVLRLPTIYGTGKVGQPLTASAGTWTNGATSYTYQWQNEGSSISGATSSTYVLQTSDLGANITVKVIATNNAGAGLPAIGFLASLIKIMPLGDSITSGFNSFGGYRAPLWTALQNDGYNIAYVGSQNDNGTASLPFSNHEGHGGYTISGAGAGGTTNIKNGIDNLNWLSVDPDVILLLIGINELFAGRTTAQANTDYGILIDDILVKLPRVKLICASLVQQNDAWFDTFNANLLAMVAAKGPRVSFVDTHAALTAADLFDLTHPNQGGYNKMSPVWKAGVKLAAPLALGPVISTTAFYVSQSTGLDTNAGTHAAPWQTLAKVNAQSFAAGTSVLFKRGDKWDRTAGPSVAGTLIPPTSGTAGNPIVYDAYGAGANPIIDGSADASHTTDWTNIGTNLWQSVQTFTPKIYATATVTAASPSLVTITAGFNAQYNGQPVIFAGTVPAGITIGQIYYIKGLSGASFNFSATVGGVNVNTTGTTSTTANARLTGLPYHDANDIGNLIWGFAPLGGSAPPAVMSASYGTMKGTGTGNIWYVPGRGTTDIAGTSQGTWQFNTDNLKVEVFSIGNPATAMPGLRLAMDADGVYVINKSFINIQNLTFQNIAAIGAYAQNFSAPAMTNLTIRDCVFQAIGGGNNGGVSDANSRYGDGYNSAAWFDGVIIERNFYYQMYDGAVVPQTGGATHNNMTIRNNVMSLSIAPVAILNTVGSGSNVQNGLFIYNNSTYTPTSWSIGQRPNGTPQFISLGLYYDSSLTVSNTDIRNNIFAGSTSGNQNAAFLNPQTCPPGTPGPTSATCTITGMTATTWDYNDWSLASGLAPNMGIGGGNGNFPMSTWFPFHGYEAHGLIQVDPSFVNQAASNLALTAGSPLRNVGANLYAAGVVWDFNKKPRPSSGPFTMGAFQ